MTTLYLIGSLRNDDIPFIGNHLREHGFDIFDEWHSAGKEADDYFKQYHKDRGIGYAEALKGYAAKHIFEFDKRHLDRSDGAILVMPAGKSAHLELGYMAKDKPTWVLLEKDIDRWDIMYQFTNGVFFDLDTLTEAVCGYFWAGQCEASKISTSPSFIGMLSS